MVGEVLGRGLKVETRDRDAWYAKLAPSSRQG